MPRMGRPPPIGQARAKPHRRTRATKLTRNELHQREVARSICANVSCEAVTPKAGATRAKRATNQLPVCLHYDARAPPRSHKIPTPQRARAYLWRRPSRGNGKAKPDSRTCGRLIADRGGLARPRSSRDGGDDDDPERKFFKGLLFWSWGHRKKRGECVWASEP
jgi:hypothetical protein